MFITANEASVLKRMAIFIQYAKIQINKFSYFQTLKNYLIKTTTEECEILLNDVFESLLLKKLFSVLTMKMYSAQAR